MIDGGYTPRQTNAQEHIDGITSGHIANTGIGISILDGGHFTGKCI